MPASKPSRSTESVPRGEPMRRRVLDAAERLLRQGRAGFSMRELAAEAGVSFATPFNQFGSKRAIMQALSARRIDAMTERFEAAAPAGDAASRVLAAVGIAAAVMLDEPEVNRAVIGTVGAPGGDPGQDAGGQEPSQQPGQMQGQVQARSRALWARALGGGEGLDPSVGEVARSALPDQLAMAFRGVLSFWTAGEIPDAAFAPRARAAAAAMLLGFVTPDARGSLLAVLAAGGNDPPDDPPRRP